MTRIASQQRVMPGVIGASAPPAIMTSARPLRIISADSPSACAAAAHAVAIASDGPRKPYRMLMCAAGALFMIRGMEKGCARVLPSP